MTTRLLQSCRHGIRLQNTHHTPQFGGYGFSETQKLLEVGLANTQDGSAASFCLLSTQCVDPLLMYVVWRGVEDRRSFANSATTPRLRPLVLVLSSRQSPFLASQGSSQGVGKNGGEEGKKN